MAGARIGLDGFRRRAIATVRQSEPAQMVVFVFVVTGRWQRPVCLLIYWGFRAQQLLGSVCAHKSD